MLITVGRALDCVRLLTSRNSNVWTPVVFDATDGPGRRPGKVWHIGVMPGPCCACWVRALISAGGSLCVRIEDFGDANALRDAASGHFAHVVDADGQRVRQVPASRDCSPHAHPGRPLGRLVGRAGWDLLARSVEQPGRRHHARLGCWGWKVGPDGTLLHITGWPRLRR